jgi:hypothetical protein
VAKRSIGIFTTEKSNEDGVPISFFGCDDQTLMASLYEHASEIAGPGMAKYSPEEGDSVKRVGEIIVSQVSDGAVYKVETGKEETGRKPGGDAGTWAIQSLIFSKSNFDEEQAKAWIGEHSDNFGNYGIDETDTSYRFRQYDPTHFDEFRTVTLTEGIAAVYGKIAEEETEEEDAEKSLAKSLRIYEGIRQINDHMMNKGVKILCSSAVETISKGEDGEEEEERFVLSMVLEPTFGEGVPFKPDTQDDVYSADEVRKACHYWMEYHGAMDLMHNWQAIGKQDVRTLENYIAPCDFQNGDDKVLKGSWMLGIRVANDDLWSAVKSGTLGAYSIGGVADRIPLAEI